MMTLEQILVERVQLTESNLLLVNQFKENWKITTYDALVETHLMTERRLADLLAEHFRVTRVYALSKSMIKGNPFRWAKFADARELSVIPLSFDEDESLVHLMLADPTDQKVREYIESINRKVAFSISEKSLIQRAILKYYPITLQLPSLDKAESHE